MDKKSRASINKWWYDHNKANRNPTSDFSVDLVLAESPLVRQENQLAEKPLGESADHGGSAVQSSWSRNYQILQSSCLWNYRFYLMGYYSIKVIPVA